jgi:hypothetical protein
MKTFTASIERGPSCWCSTTHADSVSLAMEQFCESYPGCFISCLHEGWSFEGEDLLHGQIILSSDQVELQRAWDALQSVPCYVEAQAQAFVNER